MWGPVRLNRMLSGGAGRKSMRGVRKKEEGADVLVDIRALSSPVSPARGVLSGGRGEIPTVGVRPRVR